MDWWKSLHGKVRQDNATCLVSLCDILMLLDMSSKYSSECVKNALLEDSTLRLRVQFIRINGTGRMTPSASPSDSKALFLSVLAGRRMPYCQKQEILSKIGESNIVRRYIEEDTLHPVCIVFSHLKPIKHFPVGQYYIDLYFPSHRIGLECDEMDHISYDATHEMARQEYVELQLSCRLLRYNPHADDFCVFTLMNTLLQILC